MLLELHELVPQETASLLQPALKNRSLISLAASLRRFSKGSFRVLPDRMRMKGNRGHHAHGNAQNERKHSRPEFKMNQVSEFDKHYQKRQQHHIHHAPLADVFHDMQRGRFVPLVQEFKQAEFQQEHYFRERKDDRKQKHNSTHQPVAVLQEFKGSSQDARLLSDSEFFDLQDWTQHRWPE